MNDEDKILLKDSAFVLADQIAFVTGLSVPWGARQSSVRFWIKNEAE